MLLYRNCDETATGAVITTTSGDDLILECLKRYGWKFTHQGYIENNDKSWALFDYWKLTRDGRNLVLGFKTRTDPVAYETIPLYME